MNAKETLQILTIIDSVYPAFMRDRNPEVLVGLWQKIFAEEPYEWVEKALMAFLATDTKGFPPSPGAIKAQIQQLSTQPEDELSEQEAWGLVMRALNGANWYADDNFAKLPKDIQRIVGHPDTLREWAVMPVDEVQTVVASNFQRSYRARKESSKTWNKIPAGLQIELPKGEEMVKVGDATQEVLKKLAGMVEKNAD